MKRKGFTLIELSAVIVILAIIALIATPIVLDIISDSKESSAKRNEELYLDSVNNALARYQLNGKVVNNGTYTIMNDGSLCYSVNSKGECLDEEKIKVDINGQGETEGTIAIYNGSVVASNFSKKENYVITNEEGKIKNLTVISAKLNRFIDEETGNKYVDIILSTEENNGIMATLLTLEFDSNKYSYSKYFIGQNSSGKSFFKNYLTQTQPTNSSVQFTDILPGNTFYIGDIITVRFQVDDLSIVLPSDFMIYIVASNYNNNNVIIRQGELSDIPIINAMVGPLSIRKSYTKDYVSGDINGDGYVDIYDYIYLKKYLILEQNACRSMDVNGDGSINILDLVRFRKYLNEEANLIDSPMTDLPNHM